MNKYRVEAEWMARGSSNFERLIFHMVLPPRMDVHKRKVAYVVLDSLRTQLVREMDDGNILSVVQIDFDTPRPLRWWEETFTWEPILGGRVYTGDLYYKDFARSSFVKPPLRPAAIGEGHLRNINNFKQALINTRETP